MIERIYGDGALSLSGIDGTDRLAAMSGVTPGARILDIGCGVGGPAIQLARTHGLQVTGIDLVASNIETARARADQANLTGQIAFEVADATALPFEAGAFDAVFSQDAICHVPDKPAVIAEAARVAKSAATIAFTDWVRAAAAIDEAVLETLTATGLETRSGYCRLLEASGFQIDVEEDLTDGFAANYEAAIERLNALRHEIEATFGPRVFAITQDKNETLRAAFADGSLGGCLIIARR